MKKFLAWTGFENITSTIKMPYFTDWIIKPTGSGCSKRDEANPGLARILIFAVRFPVCIFCPSVLSLSNLKLRGVIEFVRILGLKVWLFRILTLVIRFSLRHYYEHLHYYTIFVSFRVSESNRLECLIAILETLWTKKNLGYNVFWKNTLTFELSKHSSWQV